jgi:RNA polymerase sigma-70 factor (ECF subfamily)
MVRPQRDITQLLKAWSAGDQHAFDELTPLIYTELHSVACRYMATERLNHPLQPTALVHETYLRLVDQGRADRTPIDWQNRLHFFAVSAQLMRRILIDFARAHSNQKRGGGIAVLSLDEASAVSKEESSVNILALDDALKALTAMDKRKGQIVELRFFGGLTIDETASVLEVSAETVVRDWRMSKAWLLKELSKAG